MDQSYSPDEEQLYSPKWPMTDRFCEHEDGKGHPKGDARFHEVLSEVGHLHDRKQADYGTEGDPFNNLRTSEAFGLPADEGIAIRMNDKMNRIKAYFKNGELANDTVEDDYLDIATYAIIAVVLRREAEQQQPEQKDPPLGTKQNPYSGSNPRKRGGYKAGDWYRFRTGSLGMATSKRADRRVTDWFFPYE